jgi:arylsulfatase A-like enzyme
MQHAAHASGAYGSRVNRTPSIDRIAREGALLTNVFATNSICTPSRAAILTGQYSHINGVTVFNRFDSARNTVARLMQQGGYFTGMVGKWHLGSDPVGFDRWEILPGQGAYFDPIFYTASSEGWGAANLAAGAEPDRVARNIAANTLLYPPDAAPDATLGATPGS